MRSGASVYRAKFVLRRALDRVPALARLEPNAISVAVLVPSAAAGASLALGWWPLAIVAILLRMFLATLDGYVAETYAKTSRLGAFVNRAAAQAGDALVLVPLAVRADPAWVLVAVAATWLVDAVAFLGAIAGGTLQWSGPGAQADRLTLLLVASAVAIVVPLDWTAVCVVLVALLLATLALRTTAVVRELGR